MTIDNTYNQFYTKEGQPIVYYVDMDVFAKVISEIKENQLIIDKNYHEDNISGTITTDNDSQLIMTTIPYDQGWRVFVDGKMVETFPVSDALVGFRINEAGEHSIRFVYCSTPFILGIVISICAIAIFVGVILIDKRIRGTVGFNIFFPTNKAVSTPEELYAIECEEAKADKKDQNQPKNKK